MIISQEQFDQGKEQGFFLVKVEPEPPIDARFDFLSVSRNQKELSFGDSSKGEGSIVWYKSKFSIGDKLYVDRRKKQPSPHYLLLQPEERRSKPHDYSKPSTMPISLAKEVLTVTGIEVELRDREYVIISSPNPDEPAYTVPIEEVPEGVEGELIIKSEWHFKYFVEADEG